MLGISAQLADELAKSGQFPCRVISLRPVPVDFWSVRTSSAFQCEQMTPLQGGTDLHSSRGLAPGRAVGVAGTVKGKTLMRRTLLRRQDKHPQLAPDELEAALRAAATKYAIYSGWAACLANSEAAFVEGAMQLADALHDGLFQASTRESLRELVVPACLEDYRALLAGTRAKIEQADARVRTLEALRPTALQEPACCAGTSAACPDS